MATPTVRSRRSAAGDRPDLEILSALAEPTRLCILQMLAHEQLCVCHLTAELGLDQPLVSHHLRVLRRAGLVRGERHSYWTYYRLCPEALAAVSEQMGILAGAAEGAGQRRRPCR